MMDAVMLAVIGELLQPLDPAFLGPVRFFYCYLPLAGGCPARAFLDSLAAQHRAAYAVSMTKHAQGHQLRGEKHHVLVGKGLDGLFEYKDIPSKSRLIHTTDTGQIYVLLFGFTGKKEDRIDQVHINQAMRLRDEYRARRAQIVQRITRGGRR